MKARFLATLASGLALCAPAVASGHADGHSSYVKADKIHVGDGTVIENGVVVIEDGKIKAVGGADLAPKDADVWHHKGHMSAGMIALRDSAGVGSEGGDSTRAVLPDADVAWAFDPDHSQMEGLTAEGVTTVVIVPRSGALVGGLSAVVKPASARILKRRAQLMLSLSSTGTSATRFPTSYGAAIAELDRLFAEGAGPLGAAKKGELPVLIEARGKAEVQRALAFAARHGLKGALISPSLAGELAEPIKASGLSVVLNAFRVGQSTRSLESPAQLAVAGVPFGFASDTPGTHPVSLRMSIAAAIRAGLDPVVAWSAVTADAARIAGVDAHVGTIAAGKDADLVLWSGAPTDLGSRVLAVIVDGKLEYHGAH